VSPPWSPVAHFGGYQNPLRSEQFRGNLWGSAEAPNDGYLLLRGIPNLDAHFGDHVRVFGQLIAADARGVEPSAGPADKTGVDVLQAFAEARLPVTGDTKLTVRVGRQLLSYGSGRLIGLRYGPNVPLPFDGGVIKLTSGQWRLDAFYTRPVQGGTSSFDATSQTRELWGLYASRQRPLGLPGGIDLFYIGYSNKAATFDQRRGDEQRNTVGLRAFGAQAGWSWNGEAMYQFGSFATGDISAWSIATEVGCRVNDLPLRPQLRLRANVASGDKDPNRPALQTFNALFPQGQVLRRVVTHWTPQYRQPSPEPGPEPGRRLRSQLGWDRLLAAEPA
jgi:hypothetical protein